MNWDDLRIFIAAARAPTLAQAARALTIDATTVGRRLDRLARSLNTSLFESHAGGHVLTTHGEKLLAHAEAVETMLTDAADTLTGERSQLAGTVRVSLPEGFAAALVARHLPQFAAQHPQIRIELVSTNGFLNPSKREDDLATLEAAIDTHKLPREAFGWYLDLRRYGSFPHAGFGLGLERSVSWICGLPHVRETIPFPRLLNRLHP